MALTKANKAPRTVFGEKAKPMTGAIGNANTELLKVQTLRKPVVFVLCFPQLKNVPKVVDFASWLRLEASKQEGN